MAKTILKGNEAVIHGAILAGCRAYFGYPITPASEIAETAARYMPRVGGTFLQAESEVAAVNMVYGAAGAGARAMTASSGPGISLKMEGISYMAGAELPCVVVSIARGGPGLGNIAPEQGDYHQVVWCGGHGNYHNIVLAPNSVQEMSDHAMLAFDLADRYRNPVFILTDGAIGQMMEPVEFPAEVHAPPAKEWAIGVGERARRNVVSSINLDPDELEQQNLKLAEKYARITEAEVRFEEYRLDDAEVVLVAYGIVSRVARTAIEALRREGLRVGMLRPITLWPFPAARLRELAERPAVRELLCVEMSTGQMVRDVELAVLGRKPVSFFGRCGGNIPSDVEIAEQVRRRTARQGGGR
ncbi:MAG: 3-methyl-2-oxobutanoate dehydrogenase subunit VorB [Candidatus Eisenbacteria bacterium]|uniref:3-methyl-2-oxobutanoate dehydrogenase subunit VorB n=1 Tax=Eiseniibacteriota bacterium TaxID=2212470 RepID=A0A937XA60_UNCEI|nr:3-methyl-2-oxobutanoate dehydrogenase subunit VorB [Candidatus Eisenbacteria bacterium]